MINKIKDFFNSGERTHEHFNIWFWALVMVGITTILPWKVVTLSVLGVVNLIRVLIQEVGTERDWDWRKAVTDPDWYYDQFVRPLGSSVWAAIFLFVPQSWWALAFVGAFWLTFKWEVFHRK